MNRKLDMNKGVKLIIAALFFLMIKMSWAITFGPIRVYSHIGEPLQASIVLSDVESLEEVQNLTIKLADTSIYNQLGVVKTPEQNNYRFTGKRNQGNYYIFVSSDQPINDSFIDFILTINGTEHKEFTGFLNLGSNQVASNGSATLKNNATVTSRVRNGSDRSTVVKNKVAPTTPSKRVSINSKQPRANELKSDVFKGKRYGPVKKGDYLYGIVNQTVPKGVNKAQWANILFRANPNAFRDNNIDSLIVGSYLNIPEYKLSTSVKSEKALLTPPTKKENTANRTNTAASTVNRANTAANTVNRANTAAGTVNRANTAANTVNRANTAASTVNRANTAASTVNRANTAVSTVNRTNTAVNTVNKTNAATNTVPINPRPNVNHSANISKSTNFLPWIIVILIVALLILIFMLNKRKKIVNNYLNKHPKYGILNQKSSDKNADKGFENPRQENNEKLRSLNNKLEEPAVELSTNEKNSDLVNNTDEIGNKTADLINNAGEINNKTTDLVNNADGIKEKIADLVKNTDGFNAKVTDSVEDTDKPEDILLNNVLHPSSNDFVTETIKDRMSIDKAMQINLDLAQVYIENNCKLNKAKIWLNEALEKGNDTQKNIASHLLKKIQ